MTNALSLVPASVPEVFRLAESLATSKGFVPAQYIGQPNAIAACILTGAELGMGPMESLREIHVVQGRPTLSAGAMLARAIRSGVRVEWVCSTSTEATLRLSRDGSSYEQSWTLEMAKRAGLLGKTGPWQTYPDAMLRSRCISAAVRAFCPDSIGGGGLYAPEEAESIPQRVEVVSTSPAVAIPAESTMVPRSLADCRTEPQLRGWIGENASALESLAGAKRAAARERLQQACEGMQVEAGPILALAGLVE
jgi:hypothetical protein